MPPSCGRLLLLSMGGVAAPLLPLTFVWVVVMALSHEWPSTGGADLLRRFQDRARTSGSDSPFDRYAYAPIGDILDGYHTSCSGSPGNYPERSSPAPWDWICGNIPGAAAHLDPIGERQIVALSLCPVLAIAIGLVCAACACLERGTVGRCGATAALVAVAALGTLGLALFVGGTLVATAQELADFNATGGGVAGIVAPAVFDEWTTSPGLMYGFTGSLMAVAGLELVLALGVCCVGPTRAADGAPDAAAAAAAAEPVVAPGAAADAGVVVEAAEVAAGGTPVEAYVVDGTAVAAVPGVGASAVEGASDDDDAGARGGTRL